jgi:hypothetical protein
VKPGLFEPLNPQERPLSEMYSGEDYRATPDRKPSYTAIRLVKPDPCDECFANQHEMVEALPRAQAKNRRAFKGGRPSTLVLRLCRVHTTAWQARDEEDMR